MLRNELKELLPKDWEKEFKHRKNWDPEGYSVAAFKLNESDKHETVLAKFDETGDIMDYFFDDKSPSYQINLKAALGFLIGEEKDGYSLTKDYMISGKGFGKKFKQLNTTIYAKNVYPRVRFLKTSVSTHRLIAYVFIPNPYPEKYNIVNHKDKIKNNFKKENLEWCDIKWNNSPDNRSEIVSKVRYCRLSDNRIFSSKELESEYSINSKKIRDHIYHSIKTGTLYQNSKWEIIDSNLEDYLSRHPLTNVWHKHPTLNVYADECGVLKVDNKITVGSKNENRYYTITLKGKRYFTHRLIAECFTGKLIDDLLVVDHIIPTNNYDINNSINNLRVVTQKENMNNPNTVKNISKQITSYDLYGNKLNTYDSRKEFSLSIGYIDKYFGFDIRDLIIHNKYILSCEGNDINDKLKYIYYKWEINEDGNKICIGANKNLGPLVKDNYDRKADSSLARKFRKYLNTGMPATDGYYYQQGTPREMIYDPTNTELEKKRPEIHWKDRNKE